jgi:DNA-binding transcriptional ArsR family regulator
MSRAMGLLSPAPSGVRRTRYPLPRPCAGASRLVMNSHMAIQYSDALDRTFHALGDGSRRRMVATIARKGSCTAGELGTLFSSSQPTISKHLRVLEQAGLVSRQVDGRRHVFALKPAPMQQARAWLEQHLAFWEGSFDQLDHLLEQLKDTGGIE